MELKYCPNCKRNVATEHCWNTGILIVLLILFIIPGLIYMAVKWKRRCPICKMPSSMLEAPSTDQRSSG